MTLAGARWIENNVVASAGQSSLRSADVSLG